MGFRTNHIPSDMEERSEADETEYLSLSKDLESMMVDDASGRGESLKVMMIMRLYLDAMKAN